MMSATLFLFKTAGSALIVLSSVILGNTIKKSYKERLKLLSSLQNALRYLDNQISVYSILEDGLKSCSYALYKENEGSDLFSEVERNLREGMTVNTAWRDGVDNFIGSQYLKAEDKQSLYDIGAVLGGSKTEIQSEVINSVINRLSALEKKADEAYERDGSLIVKLCIAASVVVTVLLW